MKKRILFLLVAHLAFFSRAQLTIEHDATGAQTTTVTTSFCKLHHYDMVFAMALEDWADNNLVNNQTTTEKIDEVVVQWDFRDYSSGFWNFIPPLEIVKSSGFNNNFEVRASSKVSDLYHYLEMGVWRCYYRIKIKRTIKSGGGSSTDYYTMNFHSNEVTFYDNLTDDKGSFNAYDVENRLVSGDFDHDGNEDDVMAFTKAGSAMKLDRFVYDQVSGKYSHDQVYSGILDESRVVGIVSGDFDHDGFHDDIAFFYNLPGTQTWAGVFTHNGSAYSFSGWWWMSGQGNFNGEMIRDRVVSGDFDHDGFHDDICVFYEYAGTQTKAWVFKSTGSGFPGAHMYWDSGAGNFNADNITGRLATGDFDHDGYNDDVCVLYSYPNSQTKAWVFKSNGSNFPGANMFWDSGTGGFSAAKMTNRIVVGDYDTDGYDDDLLLFYDLASNWTMGYHLDFNGWNFDPPSWIYNSGNGNFNANDMNGIAMVDFTGNGYKTGVATLYDMSASTANSTRLMSFTKYSEFNDNSLMYASVDWSACNTGLFNTVKAPVTSTDESLDFEEPTRAEFAMKIFPNPATDNCTIQLSGYDDLEEYSLTLYNMAGQQVYAETITTFESVIDISDLEDGVYIMMMSNGEKTIKDKLIKR